MGLSSYAGKHSAGTLGSSKVMTIRFIVLIIFNILANAVHGQSFHLVQPDTVELMKMLEKVNNAESRAYQYLKFSYKPLSGKEAVKHYEWDPKSICSFKQKFHNDIDYYFWQCKEAGGISETISFPKVDLPSVKRFIEILFYDAYNSWTTDLKYEPDGAGCYYEINQTEKRTNIEIYCGC